MHFVPAFLRVRARRRRLQGAPVRRTVVGASYNWSLVDLGGRAYQARGRARCSDVRRQLRGVGALE